MAPDKQHFFLILDDRNLGYSSPRRASPWAKKTYSWHLNFQWEVFWQKQRREELCEMALERFIINKKGAKLGSHIHWYEINPRSDT